MDYRSEISRNDEKCVDVDERLRGISELAMACFLEGISPGELPLSEACYQESVQHLSRLKSESPVVAYTYCLRCLSAGISGEEVA